MNASDRPESQPPPTEGAHPASGHRREAAGDWFADERGIGRRLRVSWHPERRLAVFSIWQGDRCTATFRLPLGEVPRLARVLVDMVAEGLAGTVKRRRHGRRTET